MKRIRKFILVILTLVLSLSLLACQDNSGSGEDGGKDEADFITSSGRGQTLTIVSGSENKEFEPIIEDYAKETGNKVQIDYLGSLDIMRMLQSGQIEYDAVWPASSIWLTLGDQHRLLKHQEVICVSPVVFGVRESLADQLGFESNNTYTRDIIEAIENDQLNFAMTSATQSNSGASAYLAFLTALSEGDDALQMEDLQDSKLQEEITSLLAGVNRSSGSSNWLVDLFMSGNYDAMVNYEALIIKTNELLEEEGKEPLRLIYPVDGLSTSDSPLAYVEDVDNPDPDKEEAFLEFQAYLLEDENQSKIEKTGRRSAFASVRDENRNLFEKWGVDLDAILNTIRFPEPDVIFEALNMYQTEFKKPAYTVYVLDFSGSMAGEGVDQMLAALEQVMIQEEAAKNLLQGTSKDETVVIGFHDEIYPADSASGNGQEIEDLYQTVTNYQIGGGTALFEAVDAAMEHMESNKDVLDSYIPAIVVLTDGQANGNMRLNEFEEKYQNYDMDIPIFTILFGNADPDQMEGLAEISNARVFDGRDDLVEAFRSVKGYN